MPRATPTLTRDQFAKTIEAAVAEIGYVRAAERYGVHRRSLERVLQGRTPSRKFLDGAGLTIGYLNGRGSAKDDAQVRAAACALVLQHGSVTAAARRIGVVSASLWRFIHGLPPEPSVAVALGFRPVYVAKS